MVKKTVKKLKNVTHRSHWELKSEKLVAKRAGRPRRQVAERWAKGRSAFDR
jgi:hypothetical protein